MCNEKHNDSRIPRRQNYNGYKIFNKDLTPMFRKKNYKICDDDWINWDPSFVFKKHNVDDFGFCFFFSKKEAKRALKKLQQCDKYAYNRHTINEIEYKNSFARHLESHLITSFRFDIGLCKSFKIGKQI